jgi:hypothetical protein
MILILTSNGLAMTVDHDHSAPPPSSLHLPTVLELLHFLRFFVSVERVPAPLNHLHLILLRCGCDEGFSP